MVDYVADANELARHLRQWAFNKVENKDLQALKERVQSIPGVTADLIVEGAELLYAHNDLLDDEGKRVMGELFAYANEQHWTTFNREGRSKRIVEGVEYALGERKTKPKGDDPEPQANRRSGIDWRNPKAERTATEPPAPAPVEGPASA